MTPRIPPGDQLIVDDYLTIARRGRNAAWRYLATAVFGLLMGTGLCIAVFTPLQLAGVTPRLAQQLTNPSEPVAFFLATGVVFAGLALGVALAARWIQAKRLRDLVGHWNWGLFAIGFATWALFLIAATGIDWLLARDNFTASASSATTGLALAALAGLAPQVFAEELIFRGLATQGLLLWLRRPLPTAIASGVVFGSMHIPNGLPQAMSATVFGIVTALLAIRTGGLALGTGLHLANNLFGAVVVVSANDVFRGAPALLTQDTPGLLWFDVAMTAAGLAAFGIIASRHNRKA